MRARGKTWLAMGCFITAIITPSVFAKIKLEQYSYNKNIEDRKDIPINLAAKIRGGEEFDRSTYLLASRNFGITVAKAMLEKKPHYLGSQTSSGRSDLALWLLNAGSLDDLPLIEEVAADLWAKRNKKSEDVLFQFLSESQNYSNFRDGPDHEQQNDELAKAALALILEKVDEMTLTSRGDTAAHALTIGRLNDKPWAYAMLAHKWPEIFTQPNLKGILPIHHMLVVFGSNFAISKQIAEIMKPGQAKEVFEMPGPGLSPLYRFVAQHGSSWKSWKTIEEIKQLGCEIDYDTLLKDIIDSKSEFLYWNDAEKFFADVDLSKTDAKGRTWLHQAALRGHHQMVGMLIKTRNIEISAVDNDGNTALHLALNSDVTATSLLNVVDLLLVNGIDVNIKNNQHQLAIDKVATLSSIKKAAGPQTLLTLKSSLISLLIQNGSTAGEDAIRSFESRYPIRSPWLSRFLLIDRNARLEARTNLQKTIHEAKSRPKASNAPQLALE